MIWNKIRQNNLTQWINYVAIALAFVVPLSRAGISFFCALLILLVLLDKDFKNKFKTLLYFNDIVKAISIFLIFNIIALIYTSYENLLSAIDYVSKYWYLLSIFIIGLYITQENIYKAISVFILGLFISELISYGIFFELISYKNVLPNNPTPFMNHLDYSIFLAFTSLLLLARLIYEKDSTKIKFLYLIFFISSTTNLFITGGRSGQVAFFITLMVLFFSIFKNKFKAFILSLSLGVFIFTVAYNYSYLFNSRVNIAFNDISQVTKSQDFCSSWGMRAGAIIIASDIVSEDPIFGVGIADNIKDLKDIIKNDYPNLQCMDWYMHFHNQYLQIITQTGIVGLLIFLYIFYSMYKTQFENNEFNVIKTILLGVFLVGFIAEPFLHKQFSMMLFSLFVGILVAQNRIENKIKL